VAATAAVIAGVVIAPALIPSIQIVADSAAGMTIAEIADELRNTVGTKALEAGDIQGIATFIFTAILGQGIAGFLYPIIIRPYWIGPTAPLTATVTSTTASEEPTVTAILKQPYEDMQAILAANVSGAEAVITEGEPQCSGNGRDGTDPGVANTLASKFCTGSQLDFSKDESKNLGGLDLSPPVDLQGVTIDFSYKHDTGMCELTCEQSYSAMIKACKSFTSLRIF